MKSKVIEKTIDFGGKKLTLQTGKLAGQADGAVLATMGETVVLATVVSSPLKVDLGYFPLTVDYMEKLYAGGRIKGSRWVKRDGRPSDAEILTSRLIDRSIRPLFPKEFMKEVQVIATVLSVDLENAPECLAAIAVSAALQMSTIPWMGPVAPVWVGLKDDKNIINPLASEAKNSDLELIVTSTKSAVVMIEAGAKEVSEEKILDGINFAFKEGQALIKFIDEFAKEVGKEKQVVESKKTDKGIEKKVKDLVGDKFGPIVSEMATKEFGGGAFDDLKKAVIDSFDTPIEKSAAAEVFEYLFKKEVRGMLLSGKRPDGRKKDEIRPLSAEVGILPRTHGSGLFSRGQTQALTITTLGTSSLGQLLETAEGEEEKNYLHYYTMAPFSTGETGRVGSPNRREIGHGALAERALLPVIPSKSEFPYTIQVVSEVMSSNGSTSMASTCGSTLSLMDAGVPIKAPVSGIAMGLIVEDEKNYAVLTDIIGLEDFNGDMDFKVAGTSKGITALQLDVKTLSLTPKILEEALTQSKGARAKVLEVIVKAIATPRKQVSSRAPKIKIVKIPVEKIGEVVGSGGKMIKKIIAETGAQVEVEDDGSVFISASDEGAMQKAVEWVEGIIKEVQPGEVYEGEVKRLMPFGAFVEILPGKEGMVHVSDMGQEGFVEDAGDVVKIGQKVKVRVKSAEFGRIDLSMNMDKSKDKPREDRGGSRGGFGGGRPSGGFSRGGGSSFGGGRSGGSSFGGDRGPRRSFGGDRGPRRSFGGDRGGSSFGGDRGGSSFGGGRSGGFGGSRGPRREGGFNRGGPKRGFQDRGEGGPTFPATRFGSDTSKKDFER